MTSTTFFIIFIPILSIILLSVNFLLAPHNPYQEKDSAFECGFHSYTDQTRTPFFISYFVVSLLFIVFDLEVVAIYPMGVSFYTNGIHGLIVMLVFFVLLTLGFIFELGKNALTIDSRQTSLNPNEDIPKPHSFISSDLQSTSFYPPYTLIPYFIEHKEIVGEMYTVNYAHIQDRIKACDRPEVKDAYHKYLRMKEDVELSNHWPRDSGQFYYVNSLGYATIVRNFHLCFKPYLNTDENQEVRELVKASKHIAEAHLEVLIPAVETVNRNRAAENVITRRPILNQIERDQVRKTFKEDLMRRNADWNNFRYLYMPFVLPFSFLEILAVRVLIAEVMAFMSCSLFLSAIDLVIFILYVRRWYKFTKFAWTITCRIYYFFKNLHRLLPVALPARSKNYIINNGIIICIVVLFLLYVFYFFYLDIITFDIVKSWKTIFFT